MCYKCFSLLVFQVGFGILILVAIICSELWSKVSWFVQFRRLFAVSFFISIIWNWVYLYKVKTISFSSLALSFSCHFFRPIQYLYFFQIAFAEHQNNIVKMDSVNEKCTGVKKIDWSDSLTGTIITTVNKLCVYINIDQCAKYSVVICTIQYNVYFL